MIPIFLLTSYWSAHDVCIFCYSLWLIENERGFIEFKMKEV